MHFPKKAFALAKGLANKALPLLFWISLLFGFDKPYISILTIICAIIHEIGHLLPIMLHDNLSLPIPRLCGFLISSKPNLSYKSRIIIAMAGPVSNILLFLLTIIVGGGSEYLRSLGMISLATGLSNLMPIEGYDGYNVLYELFSINQSSTGLLWLKKISFTLLSILTMLSLVLIDHFGYGYWFFGLFFLSLLEKIKKEL